MLTTFVLAVDGCRAGEKVNIPPNILKSLEYYVGEWTYEYQEAGVVTKGSMSVT